MESFLSKITNARAVIVVTVAMTTTLTNVMTRPEIIAHGTREEIVVVSCVLEKSLA